jgi:hypothetical protein
MNLSAANLKKSLSTLQFFALGLLVFFLWSSVAQAAPMYRGKFKLSSAVRWGQTVINPGEYRLRFQDVGARTFAVIQDTKSGNDVAMVPAKSVDDAQGRSALLIADYGNQQVVQSLRLAELGQLFTYELPRIHGTTGVEEAHRTQTLPIVAMQ